MSRARLPERRTSFAIDFRCGAMAGVFTVGFALDGRGECAEVFLNVAPSGGDIEKNIRDAAILASHALQHGATLDSLVESVTHEQDGRASSIIGTALILVRDEIRRFDTPSSPAGAVSPPVAPVCGEGGEAVPTTCLADRPGLAASFAEDRT